MMATNKTEKEIQVYGLWGYVYNINKVCPSTLKPNTDKAEAGIPGEHQAEKAITVLDGEPTTEEAKFT